MTETQQDEQTEKTISLRELRNQPASSSTRQIFRKHALQHYTQQNEKSVLPRTISPLVFACCWLVLVLTILAGFFVWSIPVPNYLDTLGMPTSQGSSARTTQTTSILAFFPLSAQAYIRSGQTVQIASNTSETSITGYITHIDAQPLNTTELNTRYALSPALVQFLPMSEVFVGTITISQAIPLQSDTSSRVIVHYQQGTRQALSLLLNLGNP